MKVQAKRMGFYNGRRIREGAVFEFHGEVPGSWMAVVGDAEPKPAEAKSAKAGKAKAPKTFSEIAADDAKDMTPKGVDTLV